MIERIKKNFVTSINNPQKINPTCYLVPKEFVIEGKYILYIYVPESSQIHRCNGKFFDRNQDGDIDVTNNISLIITLLLRKHKEYSENTVYPHLTMHAFRIDFIERCRKLSIVYQKHHPWEHMSDLELMKNAGLVLLDNETEQEGFTLAAVLLLGKDETI